MRIKRRVIAVLITQLVERVEKVKEMKAQLFLLVSLALLLLLTIASGISTKAQGGTTTEWDLLGFAEEGVLSIAYSLNYANDHTIYVGTYDGTSSYLFRSTDRGTKWSAVDIGSLFSIRSIVFSPNYVNDQTLFIAGGTSSGVRRSTDDGVTWTSFGPSGQTVWSLAISPNYANDRTLFAGTSSGRVFRSVDGGDNWVDTGLVRSGYTVRALAISPNYANDRTIFAGMGRGWDWYRGGVYRSTDGGDIWAAVNNGLTYREVWALAISPNYSSDQTLFVTVWAGGIYRSTDGGNSWVEANNGQPNRRPGNGPTLVFSPYYGSDRTVFYGTWGEYSDGGVYRSTDGGASWTFISAGLDTRWIHCLAVPPNYDRDPTLLAGGELVNGGGLWVYRSEPTPTPSPTPSPTPTPSPVILLPGMTASAKWRCFLFEAGCDVQEGWHWMPTAQRYYQPLIDQLNAAGYTEENHYLQVFFYDWRRPIAENVAKLKAKIDEVKAVTGATEVDLVGHSMGGLVGRAYIQSIVYEDDVANLITLGSPHEGAAKAYPYWEGAFLYRMLPYESIAYPILIHYYTRRLGPNPVYAIRSKIPSIQDLLPTADYLYDEVRGDQVKPEMTMVHRNTYLPGLNADAGTLFARTGVNTFVGQSISTPVRFFVHDYSGWPYWEDGEPNWNREPEFLSDQGDGTVSATSAKLPSPAQVQEFPGVNHGALPGSKEAIDAIFSILGIPIPPSTQVKSLEYLGQEIIILALDGPVDGTITDPLGQSVGPGGVTIPGAEYVSDPDDPFKLIMIPNPEEGGFKINLTGSGSGSYELGLLDTFGFDTVITDTTTLWDAPSSQIEPGVAVSFALTYTLQISPTTRLIAETPVIEIPVWAGEIEVEGRALPGNTVEVRDADTEVLLGSAAADMSGHFSVLLSAPLYAEQKIYPKANGVAGVPVTVQKRPFTIYLPLILRAH